MNSPPPKPEVILTNFFAEPTVLPVPITSRVYVIKFVSDLSLTSKTDRHNINDILSNCLHMPGINTVLHYFIRDRPFNLKGGGLCFFSKKNIPILVEEKKNNVIQIFLSHNLMIDSGKKIRALRNKKSKYTNSCVVRNFFFERNKKP